MEQSDNPVYDLVGIGFGPANLALAIAVEEHNARCAPGDRIEALFLERQDDFGWHRGMLFEDATMQVSFLKDLVTMRNPASDYSFVSYLHAKERLADFINYKTMYPLRVEFHDYFAWAAARQRDVVRYGHTVTDVVPVPGCPWAVDVHTTHAGTTRTVRARNVAVAVGLESSLPPGVVPGERVWHNLDLLHRVARFDVPEPRRFVVVGAGQSAAESVAFLHERYPTAEVCSVFFRYGYSPADDSNFANRIFDPAAVDLYYDAPADVKRMLFDYHRNTNYSVVDGDLIEDLYRRAYREQVLGRPRLRMMNASRIAELRAAPDGVTAVVEHLPTGERVPLEADAIVYATGYRQVDAGRLLGAAGTRCHRDAEGLLRAGRDYRLVTDADLHAGLYLQGGTEHAHGITSTLLSAVAVRSGEIVTSIAAGAADRRPVPARSLAADRPAPATDRLAMIGDR